VPTLHLLRHAKSSWGGAGLADHDRPLTERGQRAAAVVGAYLRRTGIAPDRVLCSTARRAIETLEAIRGGLPEAVPVETTRDIYEVGADRILARLRATDPSVDVLLLIGHNPGIEGLAAWLAGANSDRDAMRRLSGKFPTGALASLSFVGPWSELSDEGAALIRFVTPKGLV